MHRNLTYDWETKSVVAIPEPWTVTVRQDDGTTVKRFAVALLHQAKLDPGTPGNGYLWPAPITRVVLGILDPTTGHITPADIAAVLGGTP